MSNFIVVFFSDEAKARQGVLVLEKLRTTEGRIWGYGSALVSRDWRVDCRCGRSPMRDTAGPGPVGALIGGLAGLTAGPVAATMGPAGGATIGIAADRVENENAFAAFIHEISRELAPGKTAIVADVAEDGVIPLEALMTEIGGVVVHLRANGRSNNSGDVAVVFKWSQAARNPSASAIQAQP